MTQPVKSHRRAAIEAHFYYLDYVRYEGSRPNEGGLMDQDFEWKEALDCVLSAKAHAHDRVEREKKQEEMDNE